MKALDVAKYLVSISPLDNLKLQKLLYYCQVVHLWLYKEPLFKDNIEAWSYGPVIPNVYREYKSNGFDIIKSLEDKLDEKMKKKLTSEARRSIGFTLEIYEAMSSVALIKETHKEDPWKDAYESNSNTIISIKSMRKFYDDNFYSLD